MNKKLSLSEIENLNIFWKSYYKWIIKIPFIIGISLFSILLFLIIFFKSNTNSLAPEFIGDIKGFLYLFLLIFGALWPLWLSLFFIYTLIFLYFNYKLFEAFKYDFYYSNIGNFLCFFIGGVFFIPMCMLYEMKDIWKNNNLNYNWNGILKDDNIKNN